MTAIEFIRQCESAFIRAGKLTDDQVGIYLEKLRRFSPEQISQLYDAVLESCLAFPKVGHVYAAARELGFLALETVDGKPHTWGSTNCKLCSGEGRLSVIFDWFYYFDKDTGERRESVRVNRIFPYSSSERWNYKMATSEYEAIQRCSCLAGNATTIPACIAKHKLKKVEGTACICT